MSDRFWIACMPVLLLTIAMVCAGCGKSTSPADPLCGSWRIQSRSVNGTPKQLPANRSFYIDITSENGKYLISSIPKPVGRVGDMLQYRATINGKPAEYTWKINKANGCLLMTIVQPHETIEIVAKR